MPAVGERQMPDVPGPLSGIYENHVQRYRYAAEGLAAGLVLDIGCGCGYGALCFGGQAIYLGLDVDGESVAYARQWYGGPRRTWEVCDVARQPLPVSRQSVSRLVTLENIEHLPRDRWGFFFDECQRVLMPVGDLVLSCPVGYVAQHRPRPFHEYEPSEEEIIRLVAERWRIADICYQPQGVPRIQAHRPEGERWQIIIRAATDGK